MSIKNFFKQIENIFLIFALVFGLLYIFITPPFQNVDENSHFYRVIGIVSNAQIVKDNGRVGVLLPYKYIDYSSSYNYLIKNVAAKVKKTDYVVNNNSLYFADISNTVLYSPISYLGMIPGACFSKMMNFTPQKTFYILRFCNLFAFILLGYLSIKLTPFGKLPISVLLLTPMSIAIGASISSDVMVIGLNYLWIVLIFKYYMSDKINYKNILCLASLLALICLAKCYFMLVFLIFLLPREKCTFKKFYWQIIFLLLLLGGLILWSWYETVKNYIVSLNNSANPSLQIQYILHNIFQFIIVFIKTCVVKFGRILITMVGVLGWQDTRLDFLTYVIYPIIFYASSKFDMDKIRNTFSPNNSLLITGILLLSLIIVFMYMYISWSPVGAGIITGLNGKYFIPVMPLLAILIGLTGKSININTDMGQKICFVLIALCLISSEFSLIHRFYGLTPNLYYNV